MFFSNNGARRKSPAAHARRSLDMGHEEWSDDGRDDDVNVFSNNNAMFTMPEEVPLGQQRELQHRESVHNEFHVPSPTYEASHEFFDMKEKRPDEWMGVKDTIGLKFLGWMAALHVLGFGAGAAYLSSAFHDQLDWSTSCWGVWNEMQDTTPSGLALVSFDTQLGWKGYGKDGKFGSLSDLSSKTSIAGMMSAFMATFTVLFALVFGVWMLVIIFKSEQGRRQAEQRAYEQSVEGFKEEDPEHETRCTTGCHGIEVAVRSHFLLKIMGYWMVFAGLWLLVIGILAYYSAVMTEFSAAIVAIISTWGAQVKCEYPGTSPNYGFFAIGIAVMVQLGGGGLVIMRVLAAARELAEACALWERDQSEIAALSGDGKAKRKGPVDKKLVEALASANFPTPPVSARRSPKRAAVGNEDWGNHGGSRL
ncbi:hypothetical protein JKP88DRAFT_323186 [Tribonema minus]|uniref:Transmembrane protein n=1 Tax=Tribonema minus TaxID=303371 RepID=A0A835YTM1_9STRA|nr:hypothetical protein JKP88DRAFT_323186 [Tribonema minus]